MNIGFAITIFGIGFLILGIKELIKLYPKRKALIILGLIISSNILSFIFWVIFASLFPNIYTFEEAGSNAFYTFGYFGYMLHFLVKKLKKKN